MKKLVVAGLLWLLVVYIGAAILPLAPQNVVAGENLSQSQVDIIWNSPGTDSTGFAFRSGQAVSRHREIGYKIWRLLASDQANEAQWTLLSPVVQADTTFCDTSWQALPTGIYLFAVKAIYPGDQISEAAFSNEVRKGMMGLLSGSVTELGSNIPLAGATISAGGYLGYSNALGNFAFLVYNGTYNVNCTKSGYQSFLQPGVVIVGTQTTVQNFVLTPNTLSPTSVLAVENYPHVNLSWEAPGTEDSQWIHYDNGLNEDSVGTGAEGDYDVAIRFPVSYLQDFAGMSLYAVKVWPAQAGNFSIRVWRGGNASAPAIMTTDQPFMPNLGSYNTVMLNSPVAITGNQELWFGYRCDVTGGFPVGCDSGPAINGYGNMIRYQDVWSTLLDLSPALDSNWNIQGYVGFSAPVVAPEISPIDYRNLSGYLLWRLHPGEENSQGNWTSLTPNIITSNAFVDTAWSTLPYAAYKWAVKAVYVGGAMSTASFSNSLAYIPQIGTLSGVVRDLQYHNIANATVSCGSVSVTTNAVGAYSMQLPSGVYDVNARHPGYSSVTQQNVVISTGQITNLIFQLPPFAFEGFEYQEDFATSFTPWTLLDIDLSPTIGLDGSTWENMNNPFAYIIFNPSATIPPNTQLIPYSGSKMACSFAATDSPNNDWLISPPLSNFTRVNFWARSFGLNGVLERFRVGISNTGINPQNFSFISGESYLEAPENWQEFVFQVSPDEQARYIAIQCVSQNASVFCVDNFMMSSVDNSDPQLGPPLCELSGNYPNPFNPETTISYSLKEASPVIIDIYNNRGQLIKNLVNNSDGSGLHNVVWQGRDNNGNLVSSGVYYYKMTAGKYSSTRKMLMLK